MTRVPRANGARRLSALLTVSSLPPSLPTHVLVDRIVLLLPRTGLAPLCISFAAALAHHGQACCEPATISTHPFAAAAAFAPVASSRTRAAVSITGLAAAAAAAACRCRLAKLSVCMWESVCGPAAARGTSSNGSGGRGMCSSCSFCSRARLLRFSTRTRMY